VVSTGIGTDNIDIAFNELDALANIDLKNRCAKEKHTSLQIVRIGTSGALHADILCDSFVFSLFGLGFDGLMNFYKWKNSEDEKKLFKQFMDYFHETENIAKPYLFSSSKMLEQKISGGMIKGITATWPGFYAPQGRVLRYELAHPDMIERLSGFREGNLRITNFEMETSAMCGLARILGHHTCSVNAIVANRITKEHTLKGEETMNRMIETVLDRLAV